jgi:hypothetical protein
MSQKVKIFKIACYVNLFSILVFLGIFVYEIGLKDSTPFTTDDLLGFLIMFLILGIYAGNFYFGFKLLSRCNKEINPVKPNNTIRKIFFFLEILLAIVYSIFIYYTLKQVKWNNIWPIDNYINLSRLIVLVCLFAGFLSSLVRLALTSLLLKIIALKDKHFIEQLGKAEL